MAHQETALALLGCALPSTGCGVSEHLHLTSIDLYNLNRLPATRGLHLCGVGDMQLTAVLEEPQGVSSLDKDRHQGEPIPEGEILAEVGQGSRTEAILLALQMAEPAIGLSLLELSTELIEGENPLDCLEDVGSYLGGDRDKFSSPPGCLIGEGCINGLIIDELIQPL